MRQATPGGGESAGGSTPWRRPALSHPTNRDGDSGASHTKDTPAPLLPPPHPRLSPPRRVGKINKPRASAREARTPTETLLYTVAGDGSSKGVGEGTGGSGGGGGRGKGGRRRRGTGGRRRAGWGRAAAGKGRHKILRTRSRPGQTMNEQAAGGRTGRRGDDSEPPQSLGGDGSGKRRGKLELAGDEPRQSGRERGPTAQRARVAPPSKRTAARGGAGRGRRQAEPARPALGRSERGVAARWRAATTAAARTRPPPSAPSAARAGDPAAGARPLRRRSRLSRCAPPLGGPVARHGPRAGGGGRGTREGGGAAQVDCSGVGTGGGLTKQIVPGVDQRGTSPSVAVAGRPLLI